MSLSTIAAVKRHLGITGSDENTAIAFWLQQAEQAIKTYVKQPIEQATFTEYYAGTGSPLLVLRKRPVISLTSIHLDNSGYYGQGDGAFGASTLLTAGTDYALKRDDGAASKSGIVIRLRGAWDAASSHIQGLLAAGACDGIGNIKAVYVAGYSTIPADIVLAVHQFIAEIRSTAGSGGGMQSESLDYYTYQRATPEAIAAAMTSVKSLLRPYKEKVV